MSERSYNVLKININNSYFLTSILAFTGLGAVLILVWMPGPILVRLLLSLLLLVSLYRHVCRDGLRCARDTVAALELGDDDRCSYRLKGSAAWQVATVTGRFVHPWLVILQLVPEGSRKALMLPIPWDALETEAFRGLRARLAMLRSAASGR